MVLIGVRTNGYGPQQCSYGGAIIVDRCKTHKRQLPLAVHAAGPIRIRHENRRSPFCFQRNVTYTLGVKGPSKGLRFTEFAHNTPSFFSRGGGRPGVYAKGGRCLPLFLRAHRSARPPLSAATEAAVVPTSRPILKPLRHGLAAAVSLGTRSPPRKKKSPEKEFAIHIRLPDDAFLIGRGRTPCFAPVADSDMGSAPIRCVLLGERTTWNDRSTMQSVPVFLARSNLYREARLGPLYLGDRHRRQSGQGGRPVHLGR